MKTCLLNYAKSFVHLNPPIKDNTVLQCNMLEKSGAAARRMCIKSCKLCEVDSGHIGAFVYQSLHLEFCDK
ncbi:hypothetical protein L596_026054 [Steinernema carpocapsae]|nr:hypothetical protein L596_026054 [Steinernema carpocapsae]